MSNNLRAELIQILLVEDNPDDVELAHEALRDAKLHINMSVVGGRRPLACR